MTASAAADPSSASTMQAAAAAAGEDMQHAVPHTAVRSGAVSDATSQCSGAGRCMDAFSVPVAIGLVIMATPRACRTLQVC